MFIGQGCDYQPNITLPERTEERYQFMIQFSCAWSCHCINIGSNVTHPYGDSVREDWEKIWNHNLLCSNMEDSIIYYSRTFHFHNNGGDVHETNDESASYSLVSCSNTLTPIVATCPFSSPSTSIISSTLPAIPLFSSTPLLSNTAAIITAQFPTSSTISHSSTADLSSTIMPSPSTVSAKDFSSSVAENHSVLQSLTSLSTDTISSSDSSVSPNSTISVSTPSAFHITSTLISVSPTPSVYCHAEQGVWNQTLMCKQSRLLHCPNIPLANG